MKESAGATMLKRVEREQAMKGVVPLGSFLTKVRPRAHCLLRARTLRRARRTMCWCCRRPGPARLIAPADGCGDPWSLLAR